MNPAFTPDPALTKITEQYADQALQVLHGTERVIPVTPEEEDAFRALEEKLLLEGTGDLEPVGILTPDRFHEWHVTVEGDPMAWYDFCLHQFGVKPLYIELSDRCLQLLCAMAADPVFTGFMSAAQEAGFTVVRLKHEVSKVLDDEKVLYYEAHAKFDGPFRHDRKGSSRELYRGFRWYLTKRQADPFDVAAFETAARMQSKPSAFVGVEYEACILDTNPGLDAGWL